MLPRLAEMIMDGTLKPGDPIRILNLSATLGFSRQVSI
jgi:DNA-binding GntR family transcriptional regulator